MHYCIIYTLTYFKVHEKCYPKSTVNCYNILKRQRCSSKTSEHLPYVHHWHMGRLKITNCKNKLLYTKDIFYLIRLLRPTSTVHHTYKTLNCHQQFLRQSKSQPSNCVQVLCFFLLFLTGSSVSLLSLDELEEESELLDDELSESDESEDESESDEPLDEDASSSAPFLVLFQIEQNLQNNFIPTF